MRLELLILFCAVAVFVSGCTSIDASDKFVLTNITPNYTSSADLICRGINDPKPCFCMFCENRTSFFDFLSFLSSYFDTTLEGGSCRFETCNAKTFNDTLQSSDNIQARVVAVGQGPSFASTDKANRYCNYSLQLATKWMKGDAIQLPNIPNQTRAICWLNRNTLPVYIYYTNGTNIDPWHTLKIAAEFNRELGTGPVLVTNEIVFNSSNDLQVDAIKAQILALDTCDRCLTVLAVKSNDTLALQRILGDTHKYPTPWGVDKNMSEMVDIVGFGFRANDYPVCSVEKVVGENFQFSRLILQNYSKPSIWLYVGASEGKNINGNCEWNNIMVHSFYQNLFAINHGMASNGIIGFSMYEFYDQSGPLPCAPGEGCNFGMIDSDGNQKLPQMNTWTALCKYFGEAQYRSPLVFSRNGLGFSCDFMQNTKLFNRISTEINPDISQLDSSPVSMVPRIRNLGCGEVCVSNHELLRYVRYDDSGNFYEFNSGHCGSNPAAYPEIEDRADDQDVSATYIRSLIEQESYFTNAHFSCVNYSSTTCNPYNLNISQMKTYAGIGPYDANWPVFECPMLGPDQQKPCSLGLSGCKEYPGAVYRLNGKPLPTDIRYCGGFDYDPFKPSNNICCGVTKFRRYLNKAREFVDANWAQLSLCTGGFTEDDRDWMYYYMTTLMYQNESVNADLTMHDGELPSLAAFLAQRDPGGLACTGPIRNYVSWIRSNVTNYSSEVLTRYLTGISESICDIDCPGIPGGLGGVTVPTCPPACPETASNLLSLSILGTGAGSVAAGGSICTENCSLPFSPGESVTLVPEADADSLFAGWSGSCTGFGECTINMSSNMSATAVFNSAIRAADFSLQVSTAGTGSGTVIGSGISCPSACIASYPAGTTVIMRAVPSGIAITSWPSTTGAVRLISADLVTPSVFAGWSGDCAGTSTTCTLIMGADKSVTATFNRTLPLPPPNDTTIDLPSAVT